MPTGRNKPIVATPGAPPSDPPPERAPKATNRPKSAVQVVCEMISDIVIFVGIYRLITQRLVGGELGLIAALIVSGVKVADLVGITSRGGGPGAGGITGALVMLAAHLGQRGGGAVVVLAVGTTVGAALSGCPLPPPDGCTPHSYVCREDPNAPGAPLRPAVCSPTQRWAWTSGPCPEGTVCRTDLAGVLSSAPVAGCAPPTDGGL